MNKTETQVVRNVIKRLRGERASGPVREALTGPARLYLETWVIPGLEKRREDLKLALSLTR